MAALVVPAVEWTPAPPAVTFSLFGTGTGAGWVFDAACDRVAVGAAVSMRAPINGPADAVHIIGRIAAVRPPSYLEIVHDQPWRGRIRIRFEPDRGGTRLQLSAEFDQFGLEWLMRRRGLPAGPTNSPNPQLGLLTTKSGPGSLFAAATDNMAMLALEEINAEGGVRGRPAELVVGDDATDPAVGVAEAWRLIRAGCRTILVCTTSATFAAVSRALTGTEVLLIHTLMNEGGGTGRLRVQLGERPEDQLAAAAKPIMRAAAGRRWFLAGNDYRWPRSMNAAARRVLPRTGARVVGERYAPLGTSDFIPVIDAVQAAGADIVLSTFVGADAAAFERQCHAMGLRDRCVTLAPAMDESTLEHVGADAAAGLYSVCGYFQQLPTAGNAQLLARYQNAFGRWAPPLSTLTESVFEAVHMWWAVARQVGADQPLRISEAMRPGQFALPRGTVTLDDSDRVLQRLYVTEVAGTALRLAAL